MQDSHEKRHYAGETLTWSPCGELDGERLESGSIEVPMDQFSKTADSRQTFSIRLLRLRGKEDATKNLLVNPGGPGSSGTSLIHRRGKQLRAIVGTDFHILGFDPRGVSQSSPAAVFYPNQAARDKLAFAAPSRWLTGFTSVDKMWPWVSVWAGNIARASAESTGEHGAYVNTPQTAADMNSILDALGQREMYYWGFSYGSLLGQTYAMMFPGRSARIIIDGVVDAFEWYSGLLCPSQFENRADVLQGFFQECIRAKDTCALSSLAADAQELQHKVMDRLDGLDRDPVNVYIDNTTHGVLDKRSLYDAMLHDLFFHERWLPLANRLAALMQGDAKPAFLAYGQKGSSPLPALEHGTIIRCNDMISGKKNWPQDQELFELILPLLEKHPYDAIDILQEYFIRAQWLIPKTHNFTPPRVTTTMHPLLILSVTYDPFTPLSSAHKASEAFLGSRVVEVAGYGHTSLAVKSNCAVDRIRRYLVEGILPDANVSCGADSLYFPAQST